MRSTLACLTCLCCLVLFACAKPVPDQPPFPAPPGAVSLDEAIDRLAASLVETSQSQQFGRVAVADFVGPDRRITALGEYIADKLSVKLFASQRFPEMMERRLLKEILAGRKQEMSGYFDQSSVQQFGALLGVDSMVVGSIQELGGAFDVTVRIVESGTGRLQGMADAKVRRDATVKELLTRPQSATLTIQVEPAVAGTVTVAGQNAELRQGMAVIKGIPYGPTTITVMAQGFETQRSSVDIRSAEETTTLRLTPRSFATAFQIIPPLAVLAVNGAVIELTPQGYAEVAELSAGPNSYHAQAEGFEPTVATFDPLDTRQITVRLKAMDSFSSTQAKLFEKIQAMRQRQDFTIRLWTDKQVYQVGDTIRFSFQTERDCYLNLVNIPASGDIQLIFPNAFQPDSFVRAGQVQNIPGVHDTFVFRVQPPTGTDRVYAIASDRPLRIFETNFADQSFAVFARSSTPARTMTDMGQRLDQASLSAVAEYVFQIR